MATAVTRASVADHLADVAYSHARAIVGDTATAERVAIAGMRRGGRSRTMVLAHCRHVGLALAPPPARDDQFATTGDLATLAHHLAFTRPAVERCIVDLDARLGLDRARLARALGLPPADAARRAAEVQLAWERELDPVVLAAMGPGQCEELASLLVDAGLWPADGEDGDPPPVTIGALVAVGPAVAEHAGGCDACRDRLRAMVSVRTLLAQQAAEPSPAAVRAAATRLRSPSPPPGLGQATGGVTRRRLVRLGVAVAALVLAGGLLLRFADGDDGDAPSPAALEGASTDLVLTAAASVLPAQATLRNDGDRTIRWTSASDTQWVVASPPAGTLEPGERVRLRIAADESRAPEGPSRPTITITGSDGSSAVARFDVLVENEPDLAATLTGCTVTASVEDDSEIADVTLTYAGGRVAMEQTESGWSADLPAGAGQWSVTAVDARGNQASTPVEPTGC